MCYNIIYKSPPMVVMRAGGFEPPRQLSANSFQSYRACQLHHVLVERGEGSLAKDCPSPNSLRFLGYHMFCCLSRLYYYSFIAIIAMIGYNIYCSYYSIERGQ